MTLNHPIVTTPVFQQTHLAVTSMICKSLPDQPVLRVRGRWESENPIAAALREVTAAVERQALNLAGPPYWIVEQSESAGETASPFYEAGLPVQRLGTTVDRVEAAVLPGGEVASITYRGSFDRTEAVNAYLRSEIEAAGLRPVGMVRWIGLNDPAWVSDPEDWYSELVWPVQPPG